LENFAGVMNFVIFPMFFASSALYPLPRMREVSPVVYWISELNPFTHAVELIRYALYLQLDGLSLVVLLAYTAVFVATAIYAYDPARGFARRPAVE
jgi:ABC-2 type transport system permease protein